MHHPSGHDDGQGHMHVDRRAYGPVRRRGCWGGAYNFPSPVCKQKTKNKFTNGEGQTSDGGAGG